ncbi:hypothetical protein AAZX31_11G140300 [Glycine max]
MPFRSQPYYFWLAKGEWGKACEVFDEMLQKRVQPSVVSYNSLIGFLLTYALLMEGLCSVEKYEEAKKLMFDMAYHGSKAQPVNFGVLMNDLGKRGKGLKPDIVTYNILINYLCKEGKAMEAYKVLLEMQIGGCVPNAATYRMVVDGLCQIGDFETINCLFVGLLKSGSTDGACFVLEEMEKRKVEFDLERWETIIKSACSEDKC